MKKFNAFSEALMVTLHPKSDAVAPVEACPCQQKDMLTQTADDVMQSLTNLMQPTDDVGDYGDVQSDGELGDDSGIELEDAEEGLRVKFNGMEIVLPADVIEKIKAHQTEDDSDEDSSDEEDLDETEDDSDEEDSDETEDDSDEDSSDEEKIDSVFESFKMIKTGRGRKKGAGKGEGMPNGLRRNKNTKPCSGDGAGFGKGKGRGKGTGRKS